ncbi:MAG: hypothetical protein JKY15_05900 [Deltaproteobacteria bacterium]|nr:hypothetical protein [Deltaproteobacteria bacterium]
MVSAADNVVNKQPPVSTEQFKSAPVAGAGAAVTSVPAPEPRLAGNATLEEIVHRLPDAERPGFRAHLQQLIQGRDEGADDVANLASALEQIPPAQREDFVRQTIVLMNVRKGSLSERIKLVHALLRVPPEKQSDFLTHMNTLIRETRLSIKIVTILAEWFF